MKIRLSQSKCGSTVDRARRRSIDLPDHTFLQALHFRGAGGRFVIIATQVKEAVRYVQTQLVLKRGPEGARLALRRFRADHDLAMLERDDIRRASLIEEAAMKLRHPSVGYQRDADFVELRQRISFPSWKFRALLECGIRETLERTQFDHDRSLPVPNYYCRHEGRISGERRLPACTSRQLAETHRSTNRSS